MEQVVLFVVGDELLSGKRVDRHFAAVVERLARRGMRLARAEVLPDEIAVLQPAIARVRQSGDVLLSCGGIGATPDDLTREAAAAAFGVPLARHAGAEALIREQFGERAEPYRVLMADLPAGAALIPNPVNRVAGFYLERCHFVPGFPDMAWPMIDWVLEHRLRALWQARPPVERRLRVSGADCAESELLPAMRAVLAAHPAVRLSSLPFRGDGTRLRHVELGLRGDALAVDAALETLRAALVATSSGLRIEALD
jgi:Predicted nucleotide-utilizing enzyme related to molybdopterin-biosynthesis enzyme MoeA